MTAQPSLESSSTQMAINTGVAMQDGAEVVQGGRATYSAAVQRGSAAVEDGSAAVEGGSAGESMAESEGVQHPPQATATANAPYRPLRAFAMSVRQPCLVPYLAWLDWKPSLCLDACLTPLPTPHPPPPPPPPHPHPPDGNTWCGLALRRLVVSAT